MSLRANIRSFMRYQQQHGNTSLASAALGSYIGGINVTMTSESMQTLVDEECKDSVANQTRDMGSSTTP